MKSIIRKYLIKSREADYSSRDMLRAESMIARNLMSLIRAWTELANDSRNKNDWNNFAKYTLKEIQEIGEMIKEEK
jgi:adenosine deaminase